MLNEIFENLMKDVKIEIKNGKYNQTQRNQLKTDLVNNFISGIVENDNVSVGITKDGIVVQVQNEELGSICFAVDLTIKPYDYDFELETTYYKDYKQGVADRKAEKTRQKELKIAQDKKARAEKMQAQLEALK